MRRHEKHACGGVVDVTLLSLPFLLEDDDDEEEVKSSSSVDTSILYTENCNVYTPHFTLRPEGEHTSVLCHRLFFLFVFCFLFFVFVFCFLFFGTAAKEKEKEKRKAFVTLYYTFAKNARTHARTRERTHHSPNAHKNVVESKGGDIQRFFVAQRR